MVGRKILNIPIKQNGCKYSPSSKMRIRSVVVGGKILNIPIMFYTLSSTRYPIAVSLKYELLVILSRPGKLSGGLSS